MWEIALLWWVQTRLKFGKWVYWRGGGGVRYCRRFVKNRGKIRNGGRRVEDVCWSCYWRVAFWNWMRENKGKFRCKNARRRVINSWRHAQ